MLKTTRKLIAMLALIAACIASVTHLRAQKPVKPGGFEGAGKKESVTITLVPGTEDARVAVSAQIVSVPLGMPVWEEINASDEVAESIQAALAADDVELIGEPRILTRNGERGTVKLGGHIPFLVKEAETDTYMSATIEVYTALEVTPYITEDGKIVLGTSVTHGQWPGYEAGKPGATYTVQSSSNISAKPTVGNGETVVLAGMCDFRLVEDDGGRPRKEFHEVYILVTPQVVNPDVLPAALQELMARRGE